MSLLDKWTQEVTVYPEEDVIDPDGNKSRRPSATGIKTKARLQHKSQPGTASRRVDQRTQELGFQSEQLYRLCFPRSFDDEYILGPLSQVEWMGQMWSLHGHARYYTSSPRTSHIEYEIIRN